METVSSFSVRMTMILAGLGILVMAGSAVHHLSIERIGSISNAQTASQQQNETPPREQAVITDAQAEAISNLMQTLKDNPNDAQALTRIGNIFLRAGDWSRAEVFLTRATLSKPSDIQPRYSLGISLYQQGKYAEAAKIYSEALELEEYPPVLYNLGIIYKYHMNDEAQAKTLFTKIIESPSADASLKAKAREEL